MQKTTVITIMIILFTSALMAGEFTDIGIKLGFNSSTFNGNDIPGKGVTSQGGVAFGGFVCYKLNQKFSLQQEALIMTKGAKINTVGDVYLTNVFFYFEMPVLLKVTLLPKNVTKPFILLGPSLGIHLLAYNDVDFLDDIRSIDPGLILGTGIVIWKASLEIRMEQGLLNFDQSADDIDLKNQTFSFIISYAF